MEYKNVIFNYLSQFCLVSRGKPLTTPEVPYIELDITEDGFASQFIQSFNIYHYGTGVGYSSIDAIKQNIENDIGENGKLINNEDINIKIYKGSPFYQDRQMDEENVKAGYVNLLVTILKKGDK